MQISQNQPKVQETFYILIEFDNEYIPELKYSLTEPEKGLYYKSSIKPNESKLNVPQDCDIKKLIALFQLLQMEIPSDAKTQGDMSAFRQFLYNQDLHSRKQYLLATLSSEPASSYRPIIKFLQKSPPTIQDNEISGLSQKLLQAVRNKDCDITTIEDLVNKINTVTKDASYKSDSAKDLRFCVANTDYAQALDDKRIRGNIQADCLMQLVQASDEVFKAIINTIIPPQKKTTLFGSNKTNNTAQTDENRQVILSANNTLIKLYLSLQRLDMDLESFSFKNSLIVKNYNESQQWLQKKGQQLYDNVYFFFGVSFNFFTGCIPTFGAAILRYSLKINLTSYAKPTLTEFGEEIQKLPLDKYLGDRFTNNNNTIQEHFYERRISKRGKKCKALEDAIKKSKALQEAKQRLSTSSSLWSTLYNKMTNTLTSLRIT